MSYKQYMSLGIKLKDSVLLLISVFIVSGVATLGFKLWKRNQKNNAGYLNLDKD